MIEDWSQKYQPSEEKDVLISKTCYTQIKAFFSSQFGPKLTFQRSDPQHSILFIFGPSGSGKKSTIDYLCNEFDVAQATPDQLQIDDNNDVLKERDTEPDYIKDLFKMFTVATSWYSPRKKVVFVMSNILEISNTSRKRQFEALVNSYLSHQHKIPIIFILNSNLFNEPKVKRAFPEELFRSQASIVKLKPYSDACLRKALSKIFEREPAFQRCDSNSLKEEIVLKCNGDLKQALNQMYLMSLSIKNASIKTTNRSIKKVRSVTSTQQSQKNLVHSDSNQSDTSDVVRFKDREFSLFHTLGKFLYNKRLDPRTNQSRIMSSTELLETQPKFYFEPAHLLNQLCVDLSLFVLFLHENYLDFYGEIEDVVNMSEAFEDSDIFHTFNFRQERNELQNYQNEMLNTLITSTGLMVHNITGGDRLNEEKTSDKAIKRFKPLSKPRLLSIKNEINTNRAHIKSLTKDWMVPFNCIVEDYPYDFKFEQKDERQTKFLERKNTGPYGGRPGILDEEDLLIDFGNGDDTNNTCSNLSLFTFEQRQEYGKGLRLEAFIEDDIEDVE